MSLSIMDREGRGRYGVPLKYWTGRVEEDTVSLSILDWEGRGRYGVPLNYGHGR